jgi:aspartyl-tRNA(Asn)/glutamyl-tRNA(Gln) amidotransferase subunit A
VARLEAARALHRRTPELDFVTEAHALSPVVFAAEAYGTWEAEIEAAPEKMFGEILNRFRGGRDRAGAPITWRAWQDLRRYRAMWAEAVAGYDAVILPTAPNLPPKIDRLASDPEYYVTENLLTLRNTRIGNLMGLAALTLPTGRAVRRGSCSLMGRHGRGPAFAPGGGGRGGAGLNATTRSFANRRNVGHFLDRWAASLYRD